MVMDLDLTSRKAKIENEVRESEVGIDDGEGTRLATEVGVGVSGEEEERKVRR